MSDETEFNPDWVSPPGHTIADLLQELSCGLEEFASRMSMTTKEASRLLSGQLPLTLNIAGKLTLEFGGTIAFWQTREKHYREGLARHRATQGTVRQVLDGSARWAVVDSKDETAQ